MVAAGCFTYNINSIYRSLLLFSGMEDSRSALQKLEDLGPQFSAQVRKIRKDLYQLTLDHPGQFDGWLRKFNELISDISPVIRYKVED